MKTITSLLISSIFLHACSNSAPEAKIPTKNPIVYKEVEPSQTYGTCLIGEQTWMDQNLNEPHFKNGDAIMHAKTAEEWKKAGGTGTPAWCYYNNDPKLGEKFGKLYNWYALNDPRGLAPKGWRIAADSDWKDLKATLLKQDLDAMALQHSSFIGAYPDADILKFHAYGSGYRKESGGFSNIDEYASFWSKDTTNGYSANVFHLRKNQFDPLFGSSYRTVGFSVRCLKN
jgi:uncharacterized protein (TIGR02145 family)